MVEILLSKEGIKIEKDYPYLGISDDEDGKVIVLFTENKTGTVVYTSNKNQWELGEYLENDWNEELFSLYNGEIMLRNK